MKRSPGTGRGYSPEVGAILDKKPHWVIRKGTIVIGLLFGICLVGTYFIPYPQRINCSVGFNNEEIQTAAENRLQGTIRLPAFYASVLKEGMAARVLAAAPAGGSPLRAEGVVTKVTMDSSGTYLSIVIEVRTHPESFAYFRSSGQASAQIVTGSSTLLRQIFNPILSVINGIRSTKN